MATKVFILDTVLEEEGSNGPEELANELRSYPYVLSATAFNFVKPNLSTNHVIYILSDENTIESVPTT